MNDINIDNFSLDDISNNLFNNQSGGSNNFYQPKINTNVSKNTTYLIVKNINDTSDKIEKARTLNKLITVDDFKLIINN